MMQIKSDAVQPMRHGRGADDVVAIDKDDQTTAANQLGIECFPLFQVRTCVLPNFVCASDAKIETLLSSKHSQLGFGGDPTERRPTRAG